MNQQIRTTRPNRSHLSQLTFLSLIDTNISCTASAPLPGSSRQRTAPFDIEIAHRLPKNVFPNAISRLS